jgi:glycosyltransferase involved in cell wall biosynthesis
MSKLNSENSRIAFFLQNLEGGGAERAISSLAGEMAAQGYFVDLAVGDANTDYRSEIGSDVVIIDFSTQSSIWMLFCLAKYLRRRRPTVVMSALDTPNTMLILAAMLSRYKGRVVLGQRAVIAASLIHESPVRAMVTKLLQRLLFPLADTVISNSHAAAKECQELLGVHSKKIITIHNAVDVDRIRLLASEPISDAFYQNQQSPLIVAVGTLTKRKDMGTLIRAFSVVRTQRDAKLVIIGKELVMAAESEKEKLLKLIADLGLVGSVYLAGFDINPYKWIAAAAVFVSSSTAEGFPNVIAEALALGRPIVATDCPGDTATLLEGGKWGRLVPVGDHERMSIAILAALDNPDSPDGRMRADDFSPSKIMGDYLQVLLPHSHASEGLPPLDCSN